MCAWTGLTTAAAMYRQVLSDSGLLDTERQMATRKLAEANQGDADFLRVHGIGQFRLGNKEEAKKNIARAIELDRLVPPVDEAITVIVDIVT